jgi:hypothetical protein
MNTEQITNMNVNVLCNKCGKIMRLTRFDWINGQALIDVEPCTCVYYDKIKKFDEELEKII